MAVQVRILGTASDVKCHCHSYEEILCDAAGDALYNEHVEELERYCAGVIDGSESVCPYNCFQPFEVMHLNYLECSTRPKHALYLSVEATQKCHMAAKAPYGTPCESTSTSTQSEQMPFDCNTCKSSDCSTSKQCSRCPSCMWYRCPFCDSKWKCSNWKGCQGCQVCEEPTTTTTMQNQCNYCDSKVKCLMWSRSCGKCSTCMSAKDDVWSALQSIFQEP